MTIENQPNKESDLILNFFFNLIITNRLKICLFLIFFTVFGTSLSYFQSKIYKSTIILSPVSNSSKINSFGSQYSSLAGLTGIDFVSGAGEDKSAIAIEQIQSFDFFNKFQEKNDLFFLLLAVDSWNYKTNEFGYNSRVYNSNSKEWIDNSKYSIDGKPSLQTAFREYLKRISISVDSSNGFISISFEHVSPFVSKSILNSLIKEIDLITKKNDLRRANESINFLKTEILNTDLKEIKDALNGLIQDQIETIMLANATSEYLFKVVSPPIASEIREKPKRFRYLISSLLMGFFLILIFFFVKSIILESKRKIEINQVL